VAFVNCCAILVNGHECPVIQRDDETAFKKRLRAELPESSRMISIDNCEVPLGGPLLCQTVTQHFIKVRVLGFSKAVLIVNGALLFATGNNLKLYGDILRRPDRPARCLRGAPRVAHLRAATAYCRFRAIAATSPEVTGQYDMNLLNRG
jgi:hypothetical protein